MKPRHRFAILAKKPTFAIARSLDWAGKTGLHGTARRKTLSTLCNSPTLVRSPTQQSEGIPYTRLAQIRRNVAKWYWHAAWILSGAVSSPNLAGGESERKFILGREEAEAFIARVATRLTLDCYDLARPVAYSRTTYLDTEDLAYFRSCDGPVARRVRVREYAAAPDVDQAPVLTGVCFLELKENAGPIRSKARVGAPPHVIAQIIAGAAIDPRWATTLEEMRPYQIIREALTAGALLPRLTTWYRRASMSGDGGMVRVTLDEQIAFARPALIG